MRTVFTLHKSEDFKCLNIGFKIPHLVLEMKVATCSQGEPHLGQSSWLSPEPDPEPVVLWGRNGYVNQKYHNYFRKFRYSFLLFEER